MPASPRFVRLLPLPTLAHAHYCESLASPGVSPSVSPDRRTAAEKRHDERVAQLEQKVIAKMATKSHKQKVQEFNEQLGKLSEHYGASER